jgi:glycerol uptake facilitator-like aquaporin
MNGRAIRVAVVELVGTFGLVFFCAAVVCVNQTTTPAQQSATAPLTLHQPGLVGVALAQGAIVAVLLALTAPVTSGYLNPAIAVAQWALGRLDTLRAALLFVAQVAGAILAGISLRLIFSAEIVQAARYGAPHINRLAYPTLDLSTLCAGGGVELLLTFFLVVAIFGVIGSAGDPLRWGLAPGLVQAAAVLVALPLTGAALNPVRWLGPVVCDAVTGASSQPWSDFLVYLAGPILGAVLAVLFCTRVLPTPEAPEKPLGLAKKR